MIRSRDRHWFDPRLASLSWALGLSMAAGCDKDGGSGGSGGIDLAGHVFLAQSATDDGEDHPFVDGTTPSLRFRQGGKIGASAGCNSLDGSYALENGRLVVTNAGWTEIGCEPELAAQENWYFGFLQSKPALERSGDALTLTGDVTVIEYLDKEIATPDRDLVGPVWTVDTVLAGDTASTADWSDLATFRFTGEGEVDVTTGCNTGTGGYAVAGEEITFDGVAVTEEACADQIQQELEDGVLMVLLHDGPVTLEIDADRMWLEAPGAGLGLTAD